MLLACALVVLAAQAPAAKVRDVDTRAFSFLVDETRIVLGRTKVAHVVVRAVQPDGMPLDTAPPRVTTSIGAVAEPERIDAGVWRVDYTPPASGPPQVAVVVAALDAGAYDAVGFTSLPLWGAGETVVKTKPGSEVRVKAGNDTFGPVTADASGKAAVPLEIAPGVHTATTLAADEAGNAAQKTIDLGVPPFNRAALLALDEATAADGSGLARMLVVTVNERGTPWSTSKLKAKASVGTAEVGKEVAVGMRLVVVKVPETKERQVDVEVAVEGAKESKGFASVPLVPGKAAKAVIALSRASLAEDDADREVQVSAQLVDASGAPVPPQGAGIFVDLGRIARFTRDPDGTRRFTWIVPRGSRRDAATVTVHLPDDTVLGTASLALTKAQPKVAEPELLRPFLLVGAGLLAGSNYGSVVSAGAELSGHARLAFLDTPLYAGASVGVLQAIVKPVADQRSFPLLLEALWRPTLAWGGALQFLLGASFGVVLSDLVVDAGAAHQFQPALAGQLVLGVGTVLGPGALDAYLRAGTGVWLGPGGGEAQIGLPLGASLVLAYRFGL